MQAMRKLEIVSKVLAVLVVAEMALMLLIGASLGEVEPFQETRYVFCDGVLNVRMSPRSGSEITGYLFCGDEVTVDDYSKDGAWVHVTGLPTEYGEGWIAYRYTSAEEVELLEEETLAVVEANGRVAVRAGIAGERVRWTSPWHGAHGAGAVGRMGAGSRWGDDGKLSQLSGGGQPCRSINATVRTAGR